jgi:hypothetical protein
MLLAIFSLGFLYAIATLSIRPELT